MSFFTSLTGLNAATTQLSVTSNNIANAGTTGFKRSRSDFGDIYATSPLQKASTVVGQGTALKQVTQEFSQGNIELSGNSLDLAVTGEGFFPIDAGGGQIIYTRNGSFLLNERNEVVNSVGQNLLVAQVRSDGSADLDSFRTDPQKLVIDPETDGLAVATGNIKLDVNLPTSAQPIVSDTLTNTAVPFDLNSPTRTFAASSAINIYDSTGREVPLNVYYRRLEVATSDNPQNKWETHIVVNGEEIKPELSQATGAGGQPIFVDKYGTEFAPDEVPAGQVTDNTVFRKYVYDEIGEPEVSKPARANGSEVTLSYKTGEDGVQFRPTAASDGFDVDALLATNTDLSVTLDGETLSTVKPAQGSISVQNISSLAAGDTLALTLTDESNTETSVQLTATANMTVEQIATALTQQYEATNPSTNTLAVAQGDVTVADDSFTITGHGLQTGDVVTFAGTDAADATTMGLEQDQAYHVIRIDANTIKLASTAANAQSGTAVTIAAQGGTGAKTISIPQFTFAASTQTIDALGNTAPRIEIKNTSGQNFKIALGSNYQVDSTDFALFENISADGSTLTTTSPSVLTDNGSRFTDGTLAGLVTALEAASVNSEFSFSSNDDGELLISKSSGAAFTGTITDGTNSVAVSVAAGTEAPDLTDAFQLTVDQDPNLPNDTLPKTIDLSALTESDFESLTGDQVATLMTREINRQFGDERYFDLSDEASRQFRIVWNDTPTDEAAARAYDVIIPFSNNAVSSPTEWTPDALASEIQSQLREQSGTRINVSYDRGSHGFKFLPEDAGTQLSIRNVPAESSITGSVEANTLFGLPNVGSEFLIDSRGSYDADVNPNGLELLPFEQGQQRYGLRVEFTPSGDETKKGGSFSILSGKTGDASAIKISNINEDAQRLFGFVESDQDELTAAASNSPVAVRGVASEPAKVDGKPVGFNPDDVFTVDTLTNTFTVTVNSVTETFKIPTGNDYDVNQLRTQLQNRINAMADGQGNTVSGVKVAFDQNAQAFRFETGNTGNNAFLQVKGPSFFGLSGLESGVGSTQTYRKPVPAVTAGEAPIFVKLGADGIYEEFSSDVENGFKPLPDDAEFDPNDPPAYSPVFIGTGQLTFDTSGNLIFPSSPLTYKGIEVSDGSSLDLTIDFGRSSQNADEFSVNSQSQDGQPEGSLVSLDIADDGAVTASYSNGAALSKGRIILERFPTPNGLRQLGDSTFLPSNQSGEPAAGTPGSPGYGTIRAGARERANVDLTSELVDLITAQRNFQANAKAIETSSTLTSTIINIRS